VVMILRLNLSDMSKERKACKFCSMLVMEGEDVCPTHNVVECCACGRGALWTRRVSKYICMNLDCEWSSDTLPKYGELDIDKNYETI
jgi:hypothetical protein